MIIRKAKISDALKIKKIIDVYAKRGIMLFRPIYAIYSNIRDYFVIQDNKKVIGCCALHILGKEYRPGTQQLIMAEIRSLAVLEKYQGKGIGRRLIKAVLKEARKMGINRVFTLTIEEKRDFFERMGFTEVSKERIPQKIWQECINCPRFPNECNEILLMVKV